MMRLSLAAAAAVLSLAGLAAPARAGDTPSHFSGPYVGGYVGAAWGDADYATNPGCAPGPTVDGTFCTSSPDPSAVNGVAVAASGTGRLSPVGFTGGVQAGYNWQAGFFVYGGEADFGALALRKSTIASGTFPFTFLGNQYALTESLKTEWIATIRGRLGYMIAPHVLLYAAAGAAFTQFEFSGTYSDNAVGFGFPGGAGSGSKSQLRTGWTAGGGVQWALNENWSIRAEYLYADFGSMSVLVPVSNTPAFAQTVAVDADLKVHMVRAGFSYRF